jgi:2-oxoglutarate/2-oxoacid ferredoxin oxidoreductase subunit alpha
MTMNDSAVLERPAAAGSKPAQDLPEHIVEVISDSGEGAQRCGQSLAAIAARSGNGIWTVEIIPAEIQPPARSVAGASGIRIRMGSRRGDPAAGTQRGRRQRHPHPHGVAARHQRR